MVAKFYGVAVAVQERLPVCTVALVVCVLANHEISRGKLVAVVPALVLPAVRARTEVRTEVVDFPAMLSDFHTCEQHLCESIEMIICPCIFNFLTSSFILLQFKSTLKIMLNSVDTFC